MRAHPVVAILLAIGLILPLACNQQSGKPTWMDPNKLLEYKTKAGKGDAEAQFNLAVCYRKGQGVAKDDRKAVKWFVKAAEQNHAEAQLYLGFCYAKGQGVKINYNEVVKWWRNAAEQNHSEAQYNFGVCYANGEGVEKDFAEAVKWWRKAAEQNDANAQYSLGVCYASGEGVKKDNVEAYAWISLAAQKDETAGRNRADVSKKLSPAETTDAEKRTKELRAMIDAKLDPKPKGAGSPPAADPPKP